MSHRKSHLKPTVRTAPSTATHHQFTNTTVGILLIGRAFRSGLAGDEDMPCLRSSLDAQHEASSSIVTNVIEPLESLGARIEILLTHPKCANDTREDALVGAMIKWYRKNRVVAVRLTSATNIGDAWVSAYTLARKRRNLDYLLHTRHDYVIDVPITQWPSNLTKLSFEQQCVSCGGGCECGAPPPRPCPKPSICSGDNLLWTPGRHVELLSRTADKWAAAGRYEGHSFIQKVYSALGYTPRLRALDEGAFEAKQPPPEVGFLFPPSCSGAFQDKWSCRSQREAFRPRRPDVNELDSRGTYHDVIQLEERLVLSDHDWQEEARHAKSMAGTSEAHSRIAASLSRFVKCVRARRRRRMQLPSAARKARPCARGPAGFELDEAYGAE